MNLSLTFIALGLLACTFPAQRSLGQTPGIPNPGSGLNDDFSPATLINPNSFVYRMPTIRSRNDTALSYVRLIDHFLAKKDKKIAAELSLNAFQNIRRSGDIVNENIFVSKIAYLVPEDSTFISLAMSMMDQLVTDNDSLLPAITDKDLQRSTVNQMAEAASVFIYARRGDISIRYEKMAVHLNQRLHQHASFPYQNLSWLYTSQGRLKEALALAFEATRVAETSDSVVDAAGYESLARVYFMTGDFDKCEEFSKKAFALFVKDPSTVEYAGALLFRYIQGLLQQQKAAEAIRFLRSLDGPWSNAPLRGSDKADWPLCLAECFRVLRLSDSAERYYAQAVALKPPVSVSGPWLWISTYVCLATFYTEFKRYVPAERLLDTLLGTTFRPILPTPFLERVLFLRYQVDSALRNYPRAMAALRQYHQVHDSLTNYRLNKQLADLAVQSETEKTAQHITDLEKQSALQTRLQQSALHQDRLVRNGLIAGAILLAIFAAILFYRWRTRRRMALRLEKLSHRQQKLLKEKEKLLGEKEWLLREVHHRVKNNLQIIISLLNMQAGQLKDEIAISAFHEIGARVNTISLVHKKLYQETVEKASIDMREYVRELVSYLREGLVTEQSISFILDIQELILDVSQCVPFGLILNEAITNAIKYAFPANGQHVPVHDRPVPPTISISLKEDTESWIILRVADNGVGLPSGFDLAKTGSLGMQLIQTLTLQLEGSVEITNGTLITNDPHTAGPYGLTILIRFPWSQPMSVAVDPLRDKIDC